jgi:hypothetical protein
MQERPRDSDQPPTEPVPLAYGYIPPEPPRKPKPRTQTILILTGSATALLIIGGAIGSAVSRNSGGDTAANSGTTVSDTPGPGTLTSRSQLSPAQFETPPSVNLVSSAPAASTPPAPQQVTYSCTGSAPDGVDITYGPDGSDHSASKLPFNHTEPLSQSAQYYVTTAQLQGAGSVSCSTVVQTDNLDGSANQVRKDASADGGYNIASAEVCGSFDGSWDPC